MGITVEESIGYSQARDDLRAIEDRVVRQRDALLALTSDQLSAYDALPEALASTLEVAAATLRVSRASIWRYDDQRTGIDCLDLYDAVAERHSAGIHVIARDFPNYFRVIVETDIVAVDDAQVDPRTSEFTAAYLQPFDIRSMMDVPIHLGGAVLGVLCFEHVRETRHWTADEKAFGIAVSNLISLAFERCERDRAQAVSKLQAAALNAAADAMVITDRERRIVWANPAFSVLTGYSASEVIGQDAAILLRAGSHDDAFYETILRTLLDGQVWHGEITNRRKDGTTVLAEQTVTPVRDGGGRITHFIAIKRDLTGRRALESQFLQAQKMEVVGRLAGGIAHDFNNLLTVINGTAELALADLPKCHPMRVDFERIQEAGNRSASLTRQLLAFSRKQIAKHEPLEVGAAVNGLRGILQRLIGEDIRLEIQANAEAGVIRADQSQLEQVVLNLAVNARDAMPRGGVLRIVVEPVDLDRGFAARHSGVFPGPHVAITVSDNGTGMTADILERIFEPFFTTKASDKGTGLGLATVYAIVEQSGGTIWASSEPGRGTTFTIYLPRIADVPVTAPPAGDQVRTGAETVLIVEDDEAVRDVAVRILRSAGYVVLAAADTAAAVAILENETRPIDLMLTDVVMPGGSGLELAARASIIRPGVATLFMSGYTNDAILAQGVRDDAMAFISKPYSPQALVSKLREVLALRSAQTLDGSVPKPG